MNDKSTNTAGPACSRFLGERDINAIVRGEVPINPGDTFTAESIDRKGVSAYAYEPGCRQGRGEWNNFRLLYNGLRTKAIAAAISFANNRLSHPGAPDRTAGRPVKPPAEPSAD
jgi:hypothetical protein